MHIYFMILIAIIASACGPRLVSAPDTSHIPSAEDVSPIVARPALQRDKLISLAVTNLSSRLSLDSKQVRVISVESILWPDTSLGCPRPGETYTQRTVNGYLILLEANGQEFTYHTDADSTVIWCREGDLPSFVVTPGEIDDGKPWMPVD